MKQATLFAGTPMPASEAAVIADALAAKRTGAERKANGQARIASAWYVPAMNRMFDGFLCRLPWVIGAAFTVEDVREFATLHWWPAPSAADYVCETAISPNSWGALLTRFSARNKIKPTGNWPKAMRPESRSRRLQEWRITPSQPTR